MSEMPSPSMAARRGSAILRADDSSPSFSRDTATSAIKTGGGGGGTGIDSPSFTRSTATSAIKTRGMSPSPSRALGRRRMSEIPSSPSLLSRASSPFAAAAATRRGRSPSPAVHTSTSSGVIGSAEIERMARDRASSRQRDLVDGRGGGIGGSDAAAGGSSWAQQQREKMMQRRQQQQQQDQAGDTNISGSVDPSSMARYDEINKSLKRSAPSPSSSMSNNLLERIEEDEANGGGGKRVKTVSATMNPSSSSSVPGSPSSNATGGAASANAAEKDAVLLAKTPVSKLLGKFNSPATATRNASSSRKTKIATPSSYRKTVALSGGAATPTIVRELFDSKSKSILAELAGFNPNALSSSALAESVFASGSGIADEEIRRVLTAKVSKANKWELKKQLEASTVAVRRLKDTLNQLHKGKNKFLAGAVEAERTARAGWARALHKAKELDDDRTALKKFAKKAEAEAVILRDETKDARRELGQSSEKVRSLEAELGPLREKLAAAEKGHTEKSIALAAAEARAEEVSKQAEGWRNQISNVEKSKAEIIQQSETAAALTADKEAGQLREEVAALRAKMQAREEEMGRVLEKALADGKAADERAAAAAKDMSDLAKALQGVQQSGQAREEEANKLRKEAEEKATEMERLYTDARHQNSTLANEKDKLAQSLESTKSDLAAAEETIQGLKDEIVEQKTAMSSHTSQVEVEKELRARAEHNAEEERRERIATSAQMVATTLEHSKAEAQWLEVSQSTERELREQLNAQARTLKEKEEEIRSAKEAISSLEGERNSLKTALNEERTMAEARNVEEVSRLKGEVNLLKKRLEDEEERAKEEGVVTKSQLLDVEKQLRDSQTERKRMHQLIQELRGNVRVVARVRPFLPDDGVADDARPAVTTRNDSEMKLSVKRDESSAQEYNFSFDRCFGQSAGQDVVFEEVSELVQSALEGYNVCLFSYGPTGSGKVSSSWRVGVVGCLEFHSFSAVMTRFRLCDNSYSFPVFDILL